MTEPLPTNPAWAGKIPPRPPLEKGRCEKIGISPLTLPSPAWGEGKHIEIRKKFPPPGGGRGRVGVIQGIISQLQGGWGDLKAIF